MSKVGRQNSGLDEVRAMAAAAANGFGARITRASSTNASKTAAAQQQLQQSKSSIVSTIAVNMESSYEATTTMTTGGGAAAAIGHSKPKAPPPPPITAAAATAVPTAIKTKRLALGNISNADGLQSNSAVGQSNNNPSVAPKDAKKYRFSGNIPMPSFGQKKPEAVKKSSSKLVDHLFLS